MLSDACRTFNVPVSSPLPASLPPFPSGLSHSVLCTLKLRAAFTMSTDVLLPLPLSPNQAPPTLMLTAQEPRPPSQSSIGSVDSTFDCDMQEELKEAWPVKCVYPVLEILSTEERYVHSLEEILKVRALSCGHDHTCY